MLAEELSYNNSHRLLLQAKIIQRLLPLFCLQPSHITFRCLGWPTVWSTNAGLLLEYLSCHSRSSLCLSSLELELPAPGKMITKTSQNQVYSVTGFQARARKIIREPIFHIGKYFEWGGTGVCKTALEQTLLRRIAPPPQTSKNPSEPPPFRTPQTL